MHTRLTLRTSASGAAGIEFALLAPLMLVLMLGALELGIYFVRYESVQRSINNTTAAIQNAQGTSSDIQAAALDSGLGLVNYTTSPNYFCAMSYPDIASAKAGCTKGQWDISRPSGVASDAPYFVAVTAFVKQTALSQLTDFMPDMKTSNILEVNADFTTGSVINMPYDCTNQNKVLQADSTGKLSCLSIPLPPPTCNKNWQGVQFDGKNYTCLNVPPGTKAGSCKQSNLSCRYSYYDANTVAPAYFDRVSIDYGCACEEGWTKQEVGFSGMGSTPGCDEVYGVNTFKDQTMVWEYTCVKN